MFDRLSRGTPSDKLVAGEMVSRCWAAQAGHILSMSECAGLTENQKAQELALHIAAAEGAVPGSIKALGAIRGRYFEDNPLIQDDNWDRLLELNAAAGDEYTKLSIKGREAGKQAREMTESMLAAQGRKQ